MDAPIRTIREAFQYVRDRTTAEGADMLEDLEELCVAAVEGHFAVRNTILDMEHNRRVREAEARLTT